MLTFTPSQAGLEAEIPAFADAESRIYASLVGHIDRVVEEAQKKYFLSDAVDPAQLRSYVYNRAAYEALPALDLIATENGFAVVSNQHLAPASRERVQALRNELHRKADKALCTMLFYLQDDEEWRATRYAILTRNTLLWLPSLAARYGLAEAAASFLSFENYDALRSPIIVAEAGVEQLVGEEQLADFIERQDTSSLTPEEAKAIELLRIYMAAHVLCDFGRMKRGGVHKAYLRAFDYIDKHSEAFPLYTSSSNYEANHFKPYENKPSDPCFFFG